MQSLLLFSIFTIITFSTSSHALQCKAVPGTSEWPSPADWTSLNATINGRLIKPDPPAASCHKSHPSYSLTACASLKLGWWFSGWHSQHPTSSMWQNVNNYSCMPDSTAPCTNDGYPVYVVDAREALDVKAAVDFARSKNIRLNIKSTGHDFLGRSTQPNSLSIWTHHLKSIEWFDTSFTPKGCNKPIDGTFMKVGSGGQWRDLNAAAKSKGVVLVSGEFDTVSVGGYLANGGHGGLSAKYGLGADMVAEIELVTASGSIITASECQNRDYFWAMRGGGGSTYGVVLTYTLRTIPSIPAAQYYTWMNGWEEMAYFHKQWPKIAMVGGTGYFGGWPASGEGLLGTMVVKVTLPNATWTELRGIMKPIMEGLADVGDEKSVIEAKMRSEGKSIDEVRGTYSEFKAWHEVEGQLGIRSELSRQHQMKPNSNAASPPSNPSSSLSGSSRPALSELSIYDIFPGIGYSKILVSWLYSASDLQSPHLKEALIGALNDTGTIYLNDATMGIGTHNPPFIRGGSNAVNPAFRTAVMRPAAEMQWLGHDQSKLVEKKRQAKEFGVALRSVNPRGGTYANEADPETPEWQTAFWGSNYDRLLKIKKEVDPNGVFYCRSCVGSELFEDREGILCRR